MQIFMSYILCKNYTNMVTRKAYKKEYHFSREITRRFLLKLAQIFLVSFDIFPALKENRLDHPHEILAGRSPVPDLVLPVTVIRSGTRTESTGSTIFDRRASIILCLHQEEYRSVRPGFRSLVMVLA